MALNIQTDEEWAAVQHLLHDMRNGKGQAPLAAPACSVAGSITADELLQINDLALMVIQSRQNVGTIMKSKAKDVREITWRLCTGQKPPNDRADLPPTGARQPRSGTEGAIGG